MILGLALPTYSGVLPEDRPLGWLLDRCRDYGFGALEASLPESDGEDPAEIGKRCEDEGVTWIGYWSDDFVTPDGGADQLLVRAPARPSMRLLEGGSRSSSSSDGATFTTGSRRSHLSRIKSATPQRTSSQSPGLPRNAASSSGTSLTWTTERRKYSRLWKASRRHRSAWPTTAPMRFPCARIQWTRRESRCRTQ